MIQIILMGLRIQIVCDNKECYLKYIESNDACHVCVGMKRIILMETMKELTVIKKKARKQGRSIDVVRIKNGKLTVIYE